MKRDEKPKYRPAVFVVVYRKTKSLFGNNQIKYLLLRRKKHWTGWEFPKGGISKNEKILIAISREIFEETGQRGFNLKKHNFSGEYKYPETLKDRPGLIGQTFQLFSMELKEKKIKIDKREHSDYNWFSFEKAIKYLTFENQKKSLKKVDKYLYKEK